MIDVSDGLVGDLRHLAEMSNVGVNLDLAQIPVSAAAEQMAADGTSAIEHALYDGEDFELLFTLPPERENEFLANWAFDLPCSKVGVLTAEHGVRGGMPGETPQLIQRGGYTISAPLNHLNDWLHGSSRDDAPEG
jgi:thiamine-monophosphate kinase